MNVCQADHGQNSSVLKALEHCAVQGCLQVMTQATINAFPKRDDNDDTYGCD